MASSQNNPLAIVNVKPPALELQTYQPTPTGMNRATAQSTIPDTAVWTAFDVMLNIPGYATRRGPVQVQNTSTDKVAGSAGGLVVCQDPAGVNHVALLVSSGGSTHLVGVINDSQSALWPYNISTSAPWEIVDTKDALNGGVLIGTAPNYDAPASTGLALWLGANAADVSTTSVSSHHIAIGDAEVTVNSGGSSFVPGHFLFNSAGYFIGSVKSVSGNVLTLQAPALVAETTSITGQCLRGLGQRVTTGVVTTSVGSNVINGGLTKFQQQGLDSGVWDLFTSDYNYIGTVDNTSPSSANLAITNSNAAGTDTCVLTITANTAGLSGNNIAVQMISTTDTSVTLTAHATTDKASGFSTITVYLSGTHSDNTGTAIAAVLNGNPAVSALVTTTKTITGADVTGGWPIPLTYLGGGSGVASDSQVCTSSPSTGVAQSLVAADYIAIKRVNLAGSSAIENNPFGFLNCLFAGHQFYAQGNNLRWSDFIDPEGVDLTSTGNELQFDSDPLRAVMPTLTSLICLTENNAYALTGAIGTTPSSWRGTRVYDDGTICGMSANVYRGGVVWAGKRGIYFYDGSTSVQNIGAALGQDYQTLVENATRAYSTVCRDTYFVFIEDGANSPFNMEKNGSSSPQNRVCIAINLLSGAISMHRNVEMRGVGQIIPDTIDRGTSMYTVSDGTDAYACSTDDLFLTTGQDSIACTGGPGEGPFLYIESKKHDMANAQRLKLFKMLLLNFLAVGGNLALETITGLGQEGFLLSQSQYVGVSNAQYALGNGDWQDQRIRFMKRSQLLAFRLYEASTFGVSDTQQVLTLTGFSSTDSFSLTYGANTAGPFVRGTNCTAAAIQAALRTATGDSALTVTGTADAGPFTVVFSLADPNLLGFVPGTGTPGGTIVGSLGPADTTQVSLGTWALMYQWMRPGRV